LKREIDLRDLADLQFNVLSDLLWEAFGLDLHVVHARRESGQCEQALIIANGFASEISSAICGDDSRAGDYGSGRIRNCTCELPRGRLSPQRGTKEKSDSDTKTGSLHRSSPIILRELYHRTARL
jgi:hypothetical protein